MNTFYKPTPACIEINMICSLVSVEHYSNPSHILKLFEYIGLRSYTQYSFKVILGKAIVTTTIRYRMKFSLGV